MSNIEDDSFRDSIGTINEKGKRKSFKSIPFLFPFGKSEAISKLINPLSAILFLISKSDIYFIFETNLSIN